MYRTRVGDVEIISLKDLAFAFPAEMTWPTAGDGINAYRDRFNNEGRIVMDCLCFLLRADGRTILVDTGQGPEDQGRLLDELREAGVSPEEVDAVAFTHLHGDHTGWNIDRETGTPLFPRATYLVPKGDWDHYHARSRPVGSFVRDVVPLESLGCLELIEDGHVLSPSLTAVHTPGHTPGHTSISITSDGERGFILGDVFLTTIDVEQPDWSSMFDTDQDVARRTRHAILDRLEQDASLVGAAHLTSPGLGRIVRMEGKRVWRGIDL